MRSDATMGDQTQTTLLDLDAQKMYIFNSKKKEADVWDMAAFAGELSKSVDVSSAKASFKPNGQAKQIAGHSADGHDMVISMDAPLGGSKDMQMTVTLQGPVWMVKDAPGAAEVQPLLQGRRREGLDLHRPARGEGQAGAGEGDGRNVPADCRDWRHPLRDESRDQDGRQRPDGGHVCQDGQRVDVDGRRFRRDGIAGGRRVRSAGRLQAQFEALAERSTQAEASGRVMRRRIRATIDFASRRVRHSATPFSSNAT